MIKQSNSEADYPYMATNLCVAAHPTVQAEYEVHRDARADGPRLYGVIARTNGWCAWDIESQEAAEKLALAHLRRANREDLAPIPRATRKPRTVKAIGTYWTDGEPSRGLGMNKGRPTALGYSETGKGLILSFPPYLNNFKMPELREMPGILRGDSVMNSQGWRNLVAAKVTARFISHHFQDLALEEQETRVPGNPVRKIPGYLDAISAGYCSVSEVHRAEDAVWDMLRELTAIHGTYAQHKAARGAASKAAYKKAYSDARRAARSYVSPAWPQNAPRARSKASGLVQVIKGYRSGSRYGSKIAAVRAQISVDDARAVYRFVALTEAGGVAELFEFPTSWGIWILREEIAARDEKARGRWSKQV